MSTAREKIRLYNFGILYSIIVLYLTALPSTALQLWEMTNILLIAWSVLAFVTFFATYILNDIAEKRILKKYFGKQKVKALSKEDYKLFKRKLFICRVSYILTGVLNISYAVFVIVLFFNYFLVLQDTGLIFNKYFVSITSFLLGSMFGAMSLMSFCADGLRRISWL